MVRHLPADRRRVKAEQRIPEIICVKREEVLNTWYFTAGAPTTLILSYNLNINVQTNKL